MSNVDSQILENLTSVMSIIKEKDKQDSVVDEVLWMGTKRDFQRSILYQLKEDDYGRKKEDKAISYFYKIKKPMSEMFTPNLCKRLVTETFGWSNHWVYNTSSKIICIDPVRAIEAFKILYAKFTKNDLNNTQEEEYETLCKKSNLEALISLPEEETEEEEENEDDVDTESEYMSVKQYVKKFHDNCFYHTDDVGEPCSINSTIAYLMFYNYINQETDGHYFDINQYKTIKMLNKVLDKYSLSHGDVRKIKVINGNPFYINVQIKISGGRWYPEIKRAKRNKRKTQITKNDSMASRMKRKKI